MRGNKSETVAASFCSKMRVRLYAKRAKALICSRGFDHPNVLQSVAGSPEEHNGQADGNLVTCEAANAGNEEIIMRLASSLIPMLS